MSEGQIHFGQWVKLHRVRADLTLSELAEAAGITERQLVRIEKESIPKSHDRTIERLAKVFGSTQESFMEGWRRTKPGDVPDIYAPVSIHAEDDVKILAGITDAIGFVAAATTLTERHRAFLGAGLLALLHAPDHMRRKYLERQAASAEAPLPSYDALSGERGTPGTTPAGGRLSPTPPASNRGGGK